MFEVSYKRLLAEYGPQGWWPADDAFEIMLGAVLVQRTTWAQAARAIENLRAAKLLTVEQLAMAARPVLEALIRPAGFYRAKSRRILAMAEYLRHAGGVTGLGHRSTKDLRLALLELEGIGEETADAILLYVFERPVLVVDAYLRRWHGRMTAGSKLLSDTELRRSVGRELHTHEQLNEFHALVVEHGKQRCGKQPQCVGCCLQQGCRYGRSAVD